MNTIEFSNLDELYLRVKPALYSKICELRKHGYNNINEENIWEYLICNVWKKRNNICLSDVVSDILFCNNYDLNEYVSKKYKNSLGD